MSGLKNNCQSPRVVVTGGAGYIGSVLVHYLLESGYHVAVIDNLRYGGHGLLGVWNHPHFQFCKQDIRDQQALVGLLQGADVLVHLAAIVGHPACFQDTYGAWSTNYAGTCYLLEVARSVGVRHFVFASTCSNYGVCGWATEKTSLEPLSIYSQTKVEAETQVLVAQIPVTTVLRLATVYGISPRMRFDLLLNEFIRDALGNGLEVYGPDSWRPLIHVQDVARAIEWAVAREVDGIFNVGGDNRRKQDIVDSIKHIYPQMTVEVKKGKEDPRNYRVSFRKISEHGFVSRYTPEDSIGTISRALGLGVFGDPYEERYGNDRAVHPSV